MNRIFDWLEARWVTPAYAGWVVIGMTICFFGAATNTMTGWLYVLSGIGVAAIAISAILPPRSLKNLRINRLPIAPVTAGDALEITIEIHNPTTQLQTLLQAIDCSPFPSSQPPKTAIEVITPESYYTWVYFQPTTHRGVYRWERLTLRTGIPIGLCWCRRDRDRPISAYVYPQVLSLSHCPTIDRIGNTELLSDRSSTARQLELATEGVTRTLRPYRYGDPLRSIHWRSSARYGEFQVREWESESSGRDLVIALDSQSDWHPEDFEQAVIAACSLYFYALRAQLNVQLWTAATGSISGDREVLETLAAVQMAESNSQELPDLPLVYLTSQSTRCQSLPHGSHWLLWTSPDRLMPHSPYPGMPIYRDRPLMEQLTTSQSISSNPDLN
jgi:uncharacterized protein (DUF58 family)